MENTIKECITKEDITLTYPIMIQLRKTQIHSLEHYLEMVQSMQKNDRFQLLGYFQGETCLGVAGIEIRERLFTAGPCIYVADLIVDENSRGLQIGKQLLDYVNNLAIKLNSKQILLDSGVQRSKAHKFYFQNGYSILCYNFSKNVDIKENVE